jgi:Tetratricopeptide repeat
MASVSPGHSESAVNGDPATRVPQPRVPAHDAMRDADASILSPLAQARVRESAARNSAAAELFEAGRHDEAVPLFEQALASCRSTLGGDHPDTLIVAGNLAVAYVAAGNRRKGIKLISPPASGSSATSTPRRSRRATRSPSRTGSTATSTPP